MGIATNLTVTRTAIENVRSMNTSQREQPAAPTMDRIARAFTA